MSTKKNVFTLSKILDKIKSLVLDLDSTKQEIELLNSNIEYWISNGFLPDPNLTKTYIYNYGDKCTNISGGFSKTGTGTINLLFNENNMRTSASSSSGIVMFTNKAINLSGYKSIHMLCTIKVSSEFSVFGIKNTIPSGWDAPTIGTKITESSLKDKIEIIFDVTDYNGEYYICFSQQSNHYADIYVMWIE